MQRFSGKSHTYSKFFAFGALTMAMAACSSFQKVDTEVAEKSGGGRAPASLGSSAGGANVPAGPGGHSSQSRTPTTGGRSGAIDAGFKTGCRIRNLETLEMGGSYSAMDILNRIEEHGTFSGNINALAQRKVPVGNGFNQWVLDQATYVERDADYLRPWLTGSAPGLSEDQVTSIAANSEAYQYAVGFTHGSGPLPVFNDQYDIGHRMAALMAVQFALVSKGDVNCLKYVQEKIAPKLLPDSQSRNLLKQVRFEEVAGLVKEDRLDEVFTAMHQTRYDLNNQIDSVKQQLRLQQDENKWELEKIQFDLRGAYEDVKDQIAEVPGCSSSSIYTPAYFGFGSTESGSSMRGVQLEINKCRDNIRRELGELRRDQFRVATGIRGNERNLERAQRNLERAEKDGRDTAIHERAIARAEERLEGLRKRNEELVEKGESLQEGMDIISNPDTSSFAAELDRIRELTDDQKRRQSDGFFQTERQALARLKGELENTSSHYLTTGFAGGFRNSFHEGVDVPFTGSFRGPAGGSGLEGSPNYQDLY